MKIAYLVNQYPMTSHSFIRREIAALERLGFDVTRYSICDTRDALMDPADLAEADRTVSLLADKAAIVLGALRSVVTSPLRWLAGARLAWRVGGRSRAGRARHAIYLAEACWLATDLRRRGVQHVHVHFGTNSATVMMLANALCDVPFSITCHGPEEFDHPIAIALPEKIRRAAFVVGVSSFGRSQLYRWCDLKDWSKIAVVHCGLEPDYAQASMLAPEVSRQLVCVGRLCEQKGQLLLVQAAGELYRRGIEFKLVLIGDGDMRRDLESLIASEGLEDVVMITGWQNGDEVRRQLIESRAMILPSFAEGLPVAIMESLALRRPVISTYIAGIPELVDSACGWLVPAGNVQALVDAMADCLACDQETWEQLGQQGAERVRQRHNVDIEAAKLASLFEVVDRN